MTAPATPLPAPTGRPAVAFWPLFAWLALQMLALLAAGFRIPFSARFPAPEEQLALHEMLVVQTVASALLFPVLFPTFSTAILIIASTPLMLLLSAILSAHTPDATLLAVGIYASLWVTALALWDAALPAGRAKLHGIAAASLLVLGGAVLAYLQREFGAPTEPMAWDRAGWLGPLVGGISLLESGPWTGTAWAFVGCFLFAGGVGASARRLWPRRTPLAP